MFFASTILLLAFQLTYAEIPVNFSDPSGDQVIAANINDDAALKDIHKILDLGQNIDTANTINSLPIDCAEALQANGQNGIYKINILNSQLEPFDVYCVNEPSNNTTPWMIIQRRQDGSIDFDRNWTEYQRGFGNLEGEFFIGLDKLHALTHSTRHELWIQLEDFEGDKRSANYSNFVIGDSSASYDLKTLGTYKGVGGDSLQFHVGHKMSAKDMNNIQRGFMVCSEISTGAWWNRGCNYNNLNGKYLQGEGPYKQGIYWWDWHGSSYSLKYVHMAIRPVQ